MGGLCIDGFDLIACDLDLLSEVESYHPHSSEGNETKAIVIMKDGRRFTLTAEEQAA